MALTRASRSTPPNNSHCRFEYFCKNIPHQLSTISALLWPIFRKSQPFLQLLLLLRSFARYIEPIYFAQINLIPRILILKCFEGVANNRFQG